MPRKSDWNTAELAAADKKYIWHPFTPMGDWCAPDHEPLVLVEGQGALLWDSRGREYIDGNASIWTNIHGHNHPHLNAAIRRQLDLVAHTSFLGFTNPPAIELARAVVELFPSGTLSRVFYSDDGSTGMEVALRIADQYWRLQGSPRHRFIAFKDAYHGDTAGAASLGAAAMFHQNGALWSFPVTRVADLDQLQSLSADEIAQTAGVVIEPLIQGAAGIKIWPSGTLRVLREWCNRTEVLLIADEVLTGFGRTGRMFACQQEDVIPDIMILGKALTGGYLPLAITLTTENLFARFSDARGGKGTLYYGHSYTGNALACAVARASLEIFESEEVLRALAPKIELFRSELALLKALPGVSEVRQCGFMAGVELAAPESPGDAQSALTGASVCAAARRYGLLTRPIRNVVVLMPPYCITKEELRRAVRALSDSISEVFTNLRSAKEEA